MRLSPAGDLLKEFPRKAEEVGAGSGRERGGMQPGETPGGSEAGLDQGADSPAPDSVTQHLTLRAATIPVTICGSYPVLDSCISFHRILGGTECYLHLTVVETETQRSWGSLAPAPNDQ